MPFRWKISLAMAAVLCLVVGILLYKLFQDENGPAGEPKTPPPEVTAPEALPAADPESSSEPVAEVADAPPTDDDTREGEPLLKTGGWTLGGRIVRYVASDAAGPDTTASKPIRGVVVTLEPHPRDVVEKTLATHRRVTGHDGRFEFVGVPGRQRLRIEIDHPRSALRSLSFQLGAVSGGEGQKDLGDLALWPGTRLEFHVEDPEGLPVRDAEVLVNMTPSNPKRSQLDDQGIDETRRRAEEIALGVYVLERGHTGELYAQARAGVSMTPLPIGRPSSDRTLSLDSISPLKVRSVSSLLTVIVRPYSSRVVKPKRKDFLGVESRIRLT